MLYRPEEMKGTLISSVESGISLLEAMDRLPDQEASYSVYDVPVVEMVSSNDTYRVRYNHIERLARSISSSIKEASELVRTFNSIPKSKYIVALEEWRVLANKGIVNEFQNVVLYKDNDPKIDKLVEYSLNGYMETGDTQFLDILKEAMLDERAANRVYLLSEDQIVPDKLISTSQKLANIKQVVNEAGEQTQQPAPTTGQQQQAGATQPADGQQQGWFSKMLAKIKEWFTKNFPSFTQRLGIGGTAPVAGDAAAIKAAQEQLKAASGSTNTTPASGTKPATTAPQPATPTTTTPAQSTQQTAPTGNQQPKTTTSGS